MKQLNDLEWVTLATSKDKKTRENLAQVYRDKTCLVATDGHRIHLSNNLPELAPHYLSGYDGQFPDYAYCMPKNEIAIFQLFDYMAKDISNFLISAISLVKKMRLGNAAVTIERCGDKDSSLLFSITHNTEGIKLEDVRLYYQTGINYAMLDKFERFNLSAQFLVDALQGFKCVSICADDPNSAFCARVLRYVDSHRKALIMPIRLS